MYMNSSINHSTQRGRRGFTLVELLVVIAIIVLLVSILVPFLGKAMRTARTTQDKSHIKGIHGAMLLYATSNEGKFPRPSTITDEADPDVTLDTTGNLMSVMIGRNYFNTNTVISPVETNPLIQDINQDNLVYDYDGIDGETVFWDDQFEGDIESATASSPAHNSYAHQALCGQRVRLKWHSGASTSDIILSNRGAEDGKIGTDSDTESFTLKFHGDFDTWSGVIVTGDGSTRMVHSFIPEEIVYQPFNGTPVGPDNIFFPDWNDVDVDTAPSGMPSGDNWMVICREVIDENEIIPVWD